MTEREQGIPVEAGEALDALIAEKVMGLCAHRNAGGWYHEGPDGDRTLCCGECHHAPHVRRYSTDIAAAWEVVHRLNALGCNVGAWELVPFRGADEFRSSCKVRKWDADGESLLLDFECVADSAPQAICLAALRAAEHLSGKPSVGEPIR